MNSLQPPPPSARSPSVPLATLQVRTLPRRLRGIDVGVFFCVLGGGIASVVAFTLLDERLFAVGVSAVLLMPWLVLMFKAGRQRRAARACEVCHRALPPPLPNSLADGEPLLHHCAHCQILWFAGLTDTRS